MADPLLTTLCSICHAEPPKYVCPGCAAATCSLACSQRHKAWAGCSGRRDPTAYVAPHKLRTPAGVDHDYNFLSAIERRRERDQREVVEERGLLGAREVRDMASDDPRRWRRMWFGDEVRFERRGNGEKRGGAGGGAGAGARGIGSDGEGEEDDGQDGHSGGEEGGGRKKPSSLVRKVRQRLDQAGTEVVHMPTGMARQRDNTTAWNRRAGRINWCVEWLLYDEDDDHKCDGVAIAKAPTRIRHKALETTPLYRALGASLAWHHRGQQKKNRRSGRHDGGFGDSSGGDDDADDEELLSAQARKRRRVLVREVKEAHRRTAPQDADGATWSAATPYPTQNPYTAAWDLDRAPAASSWLADEAVEARRGHRFFLLRPLTPAGRPRELIPIQGDETLGQALAGRTVLEFPTVYVLPPAPATATAADDGEHEAGQQKLPEGCILGSTERRPRPRRGARAEKRKATAASGGGGGTKEGNPAKRPALGDGREDDGGIPVRGARNQHQRGGRGGARGRGGAARGRGGRFQQQQQQQQEQQERRRRQQDAEEGEINSEGDEVSGARAAAGRADTSSSDPDTSSGGEEDGEEEERHQQHQHQHHRQQQRYDDAMEVDGISGAPRVAAPHHPSTTRPPASNGFTSAPSRTTTKTEKTGLGLVDYGSDSGSDDDDDDEPDEEGKAARDVDLAGLRPENPELVAGAIQEIVGLLS